jgi:hypothetical protein
MQHSTKLHVHIIICAWAKDYIMENNFSIFTRKIKGTVNCFSVFQTFVNFVSLSFYLLFPCLYECICRSRGGEMEGGRMVHKYSLGQDF